MSVMSARVDTFVQRHDAHLTAVSLADGYWLARVEWTTPGRWWREPRVNSFEAHGSDRDSALMSLGAALHRHGLI